MEIERELSNSFGGALKLIIHALYDHAVKTTQMT